MGSQAMPQQTIGYAAQTGNIDLLYNWLRVNPRLLNEIDEVPFVDTPLHLAVRARQILFAKEMVTLKPSFGRKLNTDGLSPLHLAVQNRDADMALQLVYVLPELIRVKGREGKTPLHLAVEMPTEGDNDYASKRIVVFFLQYCPLAITDETNEIETAAHIAVRLGHLDLFRLISGAVLLIRRRDVLRWTDMNGNTLMHIATRTNQHEVMEMLRGIVDINATNYVGQTALDIFVEDLQAEGRGELERVLKAGKAKRRLEVSATSFPYNNDPAEIFRRPVWIESLSLYIKISCKHFGQFRGDFLVVAALVATATYQAALNPPGGFWQDGNGQHHAGEMILDGARRYTFLVFNSVAFLLSLLTIFLCMPRLYAYGINQMHYFAMFGLVMSYFSASGYSMELLSLQISLPAVAFVCLMIFALVLVFVRSKKYTDDRLQRSNMIGRSVAALKKW